MAGYLEEYAVRDARRARTVRYVLLGIPLLVILSLVLYFQLRNLRQDRLAESFLDTLRARDYQAAYRIWGCTPETPCRDYSFETFLKDWGPQSAYADASRAHIAGSKTCEAGVLEFVRFPGREDVVLWVDRQNETLSFSPWALKRFPPGLENRMREWMWEAMKNCKPLIGP